MSAYLGINFKASAGLEEKAKQLIKEKVTEILEDEPLEEIISIIMIIASDKYSKDREGAKEELLEEDEQVDQIMSWLENELPFLCKKIQNGGGMDEEKIKTVKKEIPAKIIEKVEEQVEDDGTPEIYKEEKKQKKETMLKKRKPPKKNNQRNNKPVKAIKKRSILDRIKPKTNKKFIPGQNGLPKKRVIIKKNLVPIHNKNILQAEEKEIPDSLKQAMGHAKIKKRCRFFPSCTNENCDFVHPSLPCEKFPKCIFGNQCLYLHPEIDCKFGFKCQRPNCSFKHPKGFKPFFPFFGGNGGFKKQYQGVKENETGEIHQGEIVTESQLQ